MAFLSSAVALLVAASPAAANTADLVPPVVRPAVRDAARAPRFVRVRFDANVYGIAGRGEIVGDRTTGAFVLRLDAGPASERDGWNGSVVWHADATGMPRVEGNPDERAEVLAWARAFTGVAARGAQPPSRPVDAVVDRARGETTALTMHVGAWNERVEFAGYHPQAGFIVPSSIVDVSQNGTWSARVTAVEAPRTLPAAAFDPPAPPDDATLHGVTTVPILADNYPIIGVSIDGGAPLRFVLDTGGQNVITTAAARRAHLDVVGAGKVGGVGTELADTAYATVRSVRVGGAELRDQPFYVLDLGVAPIDGIVGYELLARFAARVDLQHGRLELARDARDLSPSGTPVRMTLDNRQPQVDGAIDGIPGVITIDTGSSGGLDVESPFVTAHDLHARLRTLTAGSANGVGGGARGTMARAKELRLGTVVVPNPPVFLVDEKTGGYADPTIAANVGNQILKRFSLVFDYRESVIHFETSAP